MGQPASQKRCICPPFLSQAWEDTWKRFQSNLGCGPVCWEESSVLCGGSFHTAEVCGFLWINPQELLAPGEWSEIQAGRLLWWGRYTQCLEMSGQKCCSCGRTWSRDSCPERLACGWVGGCEGVPSWHHSHQILLRTCLHLSLAIPHSPASARCVHGGDLSQKCHHGKAGMRPVGAVTSRAVEKTDGSFSWDCKMQQYRDKSLLLPQLLTWKMFL